ncbi:putative disease resistance protein RGA3 [Arachis hypogaea]|uniref:putative disease resistance protein RGA3 n=1 Tax=Arachis hypogaea TaxID=3818 RepID=UPI000DEDD1F1|nr:putative disease resistance protein RGA3 [Arachis hypogaea]
MVKMQNKLQELAREMDGSFVDELHKLGMPYSTVGNFQSSLLLDESVVIGRESDKREVIKLLLDEKMGGRSNLSVIAIVGMEGVGKTILAQLVYNNVDLDSNFNLENWVSVFVEYNIERVTRSIFECACREKVKLSDLEPIQMRLEEILNGKKFLIVVDGF